MMTFERALMGSAIIAIVACSTPMPASAQTLRELWIGNSCQHPVQMYIRNAAAYHTWQTSGPFKLAASSDPAKIVVDGNALQQLDDHGLYYYAEATDGSGNIWEEPKGSGNEVPINGTVYRMKHAGKELVRGHLELTISC